MQEYLGFVDYIGRTLNGGYIYRFDFTEDIDTFWGEGFNECPACIIPDLQPDTAYISKQIKVETEYRLLLAKKNTCFSFQDCIDGIISLCFSDLNENYPLIDEKPVYFNFGEEYELVNEKILKCNAKIIEEISYIEEKEKEIDKIIESANIKSSNIPFISFEVGEEIDYENLPTLLIGQDYKRVDNVSKYGEFSVRGNLIDIFSFFDVIPYRISLFGNKIESIYSFNKDTNEKIENLENIIIYRNYNPDIDF